jgi:hypothetical protein
MIGSYWGQQKGLPTIDASFRLSEGSAITGALAWGEGASEGTMRGRTQPILLNHHHKLVWKDYSDLEIGTFGKFRYLLLKVGRIEIV